MWSGVCCHEKMVYYNTNVLFRNYIFEGFENAFLNVKSILVLVPCVQEVAIHVILFIVLLLPR